MRNVCKTVPEATAAGGPCGQVGRQPIKMEKPVFCEEQETGFFFVFFLNEERL